MQKAFLGYFLIFTVALSGLLSGYDTGVISGALLYIDKSFNLTSEISGLLVGSVSVGAVFGAIINGNIIDKIGRKKVLLISAFIFLTASIFASVSKTIVQLILSRFFIGIAVGIVSFAGPLYLSEISFKEKRGSIVSLYQIALTFGILFSYLSNYFCSDLQNSWRIMFFVGVIPALVMFIGMLFQTDTPRWYVLKNKIELAKNALKKFGTNIDVDVEIESIQKTLFSDDKLEFNKKLLFPFVIGIGIMFVQIATGINAIIYYAPTIFKQMGTLSDDKVLLITIFIGLINFLMTFVAFVFVDKLGRKPLLYIGLGGMFFSLLLLSSIFAFNFMYEEYIAIIACAIYIISFSMSLGPIALLLISEIFPLKYRGSAMSIAIVSNFIFNFIVTGLFPVALDKIGGCYTFLIFALICLLSFIFIWLAVPETKGLSLEQIESRWK